MPGLSPKVCFVVLAATMGAVTNILPSIAEEFGLSDGWFKTCSQTADAKICNVQTQTYAGTGQVITSINLFEVSGKENRKLFQITVPTSRSIPSGLKIQIDDQKAELMPYVFCTPARCMAERKLTDSIVSQLKAGTKIQVTSTNWQGKENPVLVSLEGFGDAFDGNSLSSAQLEERKQKFDQMLQERSAATLKKLQEAQQKARDSE